MLPWTPSLLHVTNRMLTCWLIKTAQYDNTQHVWSHVKEQSFLYMKGGSVLWKNYNRLLELEITYCYVFVTVLCLLCQNLQNRIQIKHFYMCNNTLELLVFLHHLLQFIYPVIRTLLFKIPAVRRVMWGL